MSDDKGPFDFEGFTDEEIGNVEHNSDLGVNVDVNPQPIVETESEYSDSEDYIDDNFPGAQNLQIGQLGFNSTYYTTTVPINFTSTPVGSPERNNVGTLVSKYEKELQSRSNPEIGSSINSETLKLK